MNKVVRFPSPPGPSLETLLRRSVDLLSATQIDRAARLAELRAARNKLADETQDFYCTKTARDIHYAEQDLEDWDRLHGRELDLLADELGA